MIMTELNTSYYKNISENNIEEAFCFKTDLTILQCYVQKCEFVIGPVTLKLEFEDGNYQFNIPQKITFYLMMREFSMSTPREN